MVVCVLPFICEIMCKGDSNSQYKVRSQHFDKLRLPRSDVSSKYNASMQQYHLHVYMCFKSGAYKAYSQIVRVHIYVRKLQINTFIVQLDTIV